MRTRVYITAHWFTRFCNVQACHRIPMSYDTIPRSPTITVHRDLVSAFRRSASDTHTRGTCSETAVRPLPRPLRRPTALPTAPSSPPHTQHRASRHAAVCNSAPIMHSHAPLSSSPGLKHEGCPSVLWPLLSGARCWCCRASVACELCPSDTRCLRCRYGLERGSLVLKQPVAHNHVSPHLHHAGDR